VDASLTKLIAVVVTVVWVGSIIVDILVPAYDPPPSVHLTMMAVVGAATGRYIIWRNGR